MADYKLQWKHIASVLKSILQTKIQILEKPNKIDYCSYEIVLFVARTNGLL